MNKEMLIRLNSDSSYVEYGLRDNFGNMAFKKINTKEFVSMVNQIYEAKITTRKDIALYEDGVIGADAKHIVVNQPERKRIVSYSDLLKGDIKIYNIIFPNSLYIIRHTNGRILDIECYAYKEFKGEETALFEYPMPNELSGNKICIGSADRTIKNNKIVEALEKIIFTPYSHESFSGINGFTKTEVYFEYLQKNDFPYKLLRPLKKKLGDVLHG